MTTNAIRSPTNRSAGTIVEGNGIVELCRRLAHTTAGAEPHLNQAFVNDELQGLIDGIILDFLQKGPLLGYPSGTKNSKTPRR